MRMPTPHPSRVAASALLALCLAAVMPYPAAAQVQDDAGFFTADAVTRANQTIDKIKRDYGKDLRIETHPSIPANLQADFQRLGKDEFYQQWAIQRGKDVRLNGVMVLITRDPGRIQAQVGENTRRREFTTADQEEMRKALADAFVAKNYDAGLLQAVDFVYRRMGENVRNRPAPPRAGGASGSSTGGGAAAFPPPPGGSSGGSGGAPNRTSTVPPGATPGPGRSSGVTVCGGGMGSFLCMAIAIIGVLMLVRGIFSRRSGTGYGGGGFGQGAGVPPNVPYGGQPGYGYGGGAPGGGFGRGMLGGLLGGVLGGWAYDKMGRGSAQGAPPPSGMGTGGGTLPPTDPSTYDTGGGGSDFGGGGGADFGGGGSDFGGGGGSDFGGGGGGGDSGGGGSDF